MTPSFSVRTTPHYDRLAWKLHRRHREFLALQERAIDILQADPFNRSGRHAIRKLEGVAPGEGQWRLRLGRFRFRYDVSGREVGLLYCGLRREDTYRP